MKKHGRVLSALLILCFALATLPLNASANEQHAKFNVGYRIMDFPWEEAKAGKITVAVWYPTGAQSETFYYPVPYTVGCVAKDAPVDGENAPYPLIIVSHGYGGSGISAVFLTEHLASLGYIVVAPDYEDRDKPATIRGRKNPVRVMEFLRNALRIARTGKEFDRAAYSYRPRTLKFVLDRMLELNESKESDFRGTIDVRRIGAVGHSLGSYTTLAALGLDEKNADNRIKAAVLLSGGVFMFQPEEFRRIKVPVMFMFGSLEQGARERWGLSDLAKDTLTAYENCPTPKLMLEIKDATHFSFCQLVYRTLPAIRNPNLADEQVRVINTYTAAFFERFLKGNKSAEETLAKPDEMMVTFKCSLNGKTVETRKESVERKPQRKSQATKFEVKTVSNIAYYDGEGADEKKHTLDLYLPAGAEKFPVLMFIHGGGWHMGDKGNRKPSSLGRKLAARGVGAAVINYRLSPAVTHPEHIKDCARALAWVRENIPQYGGDPTRIFVSGQSAGGHLAALLATNEKYLKEVGLSTRNIAGVIAISGVYLVKGNLFGAFGDDPEAYRDASPMEHVRAGLPPFLIIYAERDPLSIRALSRAFANKLDLMGDSVRLVEIPDRNHFTILSGVGAENDAVTDIILDFVFRGHRRETATASATE